MGLRMSDTFSDMGMNALEQALYDCAADEVESKGRPRPTSQDRYDVYDYLRQMPRTSLVAELVDKLRENGFEIVPKDVNAKDTKEGK